MCCGPPQPTLQSATAKAFSATVATVAVMAIPTSAAFSLARTSAPGTIVAGWWKADGSGFCDIGGPRPRYYLDCNLPCDDSCGCNGSGVCKSECTSADCRCAGGDCHSRSVDCTRFRYGQCNQDVPCLGPIACRIVTCVPPWDWDHSCTTEVATDNQTALHDRPCLHQGFTDVAPDSWYTEPVLWMAEQGITTGFTADLFGPRELATRAHIAAFLWRYFGRPIAAVPSVFSDVSADAYYSPAVAWMSEQNITRGTSASTFSPDREVTRAEAITLLWRAAGRPGGNPAHGFDDVEASAYFYEPVAWAKATGITMGVSPTASVPPTTSTGPRSPPSCSAITTMWLRPAVVVCVVRSRFDDGARDFARCCGWCLVSNRLWSFAHPR